MRGSSILISLFALGAGLAHYLHGPANASDFAGQMQSLVGHKHGEITIRSVEAEGNILVITLDGPLGWRQAMPTYAMTAYFVDRICEDPKTATYFKDGRLLRLDTNDSGGRVVHGVPTDHCPPPSTSPISG